MNPPERSPDLHCGRARVDSTSPYAPFQEVDCCEQRPLQVYQCRKRSYLLRFFQYPGQRIVSILFSLKIGLYHDLVQTFDDTFVILDALDEFKQRQDLLDHIQEIVECDSGSLHILVTSRREWDIKQTFDPLLNDNQNIDIQSEVVDRDIRVYVRELLQSAKGLSRWHNKPEVQDEIEKALTENANGM